MKDHSYIVKTIIQNQIAMADENHYFLSTEIIKSRAHTLMDLECKNSFQNGFCRVGLNQIIEQWLYTFGYYSIGKGRFVNLDKCFDERSLDLVIQNAENNVLIKRKAYKKKRELANGQGRFHFVGNKLNGLVFAMTPEEYDSYVDAHTVGM